MCSSALPVLNAQETTATPECPHTNPEICTGVEVKDVADEPSQPQAIVESEEGRADLPVKHSISHTEPSTLDMDFTDSASTGELPSPVSFRYCM